MTWYDGLYLNDPSTDNIFGLEILGERRRPALLDFLRRGGRLDDFAGLAAEHKGREDLMALLDRVINRPPDAA